jgi:hypothetical protein
LNPQHWTGGIDLAVFKSGNVVPKDTGWLRTDFPVHGLEKKQDIG